MSRVDNFSVIKRCEAPTEKSIYPEPYKGICEGRKTEEVPSPFQHAEYGPATGDGG